MSAGAPSFGAYLTHRDVARVTPVRNSKAVLGVLFGLLALVILVVGGLRTSSETTIDQLGIASIPTAFVAALIALSFSRRGRFYFQRTLGRAGGRRLSALARALSILALLLSFAGALAIAVFAVLKLVA